MMLGAFGFLLGPIGLAWTMLLGSAFSLAYRVWVQRQRGRPVRKGLVPLGPGMTVGAAVVFLCVNFGVAFAAGEPPPHGVPARPVSVAPLPGLTPDNALLPATELVPAGSPPPEAIATRDVVLEQNDAVSFPVAVRRLSSLSGISITIEERPARIAGGMAILSDAPPIRLVGEPVKKLSAKSKRQRVRFPKAPPPLILPEDIPSILETCRRNREKLLGS